MVKRASRRPPTDQSGSESMRRALLACAAAIAIAGAVSLGLLVIPVVYTYVDDFIEWGKARFRKFSTA